MVIVYIIVGDTIADLSQVDEQAEASVGISLGKYRTGVFAEGKCCNDAVIVHQCQFYGHVILQFDKTWQALCIRWLVRFGK